MMTIGQALVQVSQMAIKNLKRCHAYVCCACYQKSAIMASGCGSKETRTQVSLWGQENVQNELDTAIRNRTVYEQIVREMGKRGYERTRQQKYRKVSICCLSYLILQANCP